MSKKILLIRVKESHGLPIGYGYLVESWKKAGIEFEFVDLYRDPDFDINARCAKGDILAIACGGVIPLYSAFKKIFCSVKESFPNIPCILGGPILTNIPLEFIFRRIPFDYGVIGEGEITSVELIKHIADKGISACPNILGVAYRDRSNIQGYTRNKARPWADINSIPQLSWDFLDYKWYLSQAQSSTMFVVSSRGCPGDCAFCSSPLGPHRTRAPDLIIKEISDMSKIYTFERIHFRDDMFFNTFEEIESFCSLYKGIGTPYPWRANMRLDGPLEAMELMRDAGCYLLTIGFESVCDRVLKKMNKRTTHAMQKRALKMGKKVNLEIHTFWMAGNYSETREELEASFEFFTKTAHHPTPSLLITYPGTLNYSRAKRQGVVQNEDEYIESLYEQFINPLFYRMSRIFANDLPHANISAMNTNELLETMISGYRAGTKDMQLKNLSCQRENSSLINISGTCPKCNGIINIPITRDTEPVNIHITQCPYCVPLWITVDPFDIEEYKDYYQKNIVPFLEKSNRIIILEGNPYKAHFFIVKDHFKLADKKTVFFTAKDYTIGNILNYPVIEKAKIAEFHPDCIVVTAQNPINGLLLEELTVVLHEKNMEIPILFLDTPALAQRRG